LKKLDFYLFINKQKNLETIN